MITLSEDSVGCGDTMQSRDESGRDEDVIGCGAIGCAKEGEVGLCGVLNRSGVMKREM